MLYTGYFANTKKYEEAGLTPVSIAGKTPDFFKGPKWGKFAPKKELFVQWKNGVIDDEEYVRSYIGNLCKTITSQDLCNISKLAEAKDIVLCCYEKSGDFCHRIYLASWLGATLKTEVKEWTF